MLYFEEAYSNGPTNYVHDLIENLYSSQTHDAAECYDGLNFQKEKYELRSKIIKSANN